MQAHEEAASALRLKAAIAAGRMLVAGWRLQYALKRNSSWHLQPRVPAGNSDGGQWTDGAGSEDSAGTRIAQNENPERYSVNLLEEEAPIGIGHTIQDHVGRSPESLLARVRGERYLGIFGTVARYRDGSFPSIQAANKLVNSTLSRNKAVVDAIASGAIAEKTLITAIFSSKTGIEAFRKSEYEQPYLRDTHGVGVVIVHDPGSRTGYRVLTAYPRND
jgi:hypothetical protein